MATSDSSDRNQNRADVARPRNLHARYHAHVYFDASTIAQARELCAQAAASFGVAMGRVHEKPVGPHPHWSCQLTFDSTQFDRLIPWLDRQRGGLDILVHPTTGDALADHTTHASWLGEPAELNLARLGAPSADARPTR
ncbi:MAG: 4,5-dioxygenase [Betaproteobacteria bacterium]|nr:4,5-dioxygenase [Betaproteobacteria bacterium]